MGPLVDAVGLEVVMINGEHQGEGFALREPDQGGIGQVHGPVGVAGHERFEVRCVIVGDGKDGHRPGAEEPPGVRDVIRVGAEEVEQLGKNRGGGVLLAVKKRLQSTEICSSDTMEILAVRFYCPMLSTFLL